jgi:hypothetical protein
VTPRFVEQKSVGNLRWEWAQPVPERGTSVFVIPARFGGRRGNSGVKNREDRLVVLNATAKAVIEACRSEHAQFVFVYWGSRSSS